MNTQRPQSRLTPQNPSRLPRTAGRLAAHAAVFAALLVLSGCSSVTGGSAGVGDANASPSPHGSAFERDRAAILAMVGEFDVDFRFFETFGIAPDYELHDPYNSGATEYVELVEDAGDRIVLQHILVMEFEDQDDPVVIKHWRQDWVYEDPEMLVYRGHRVFQRVRLSPEARAGTWTQAVYQVDDSPRYEGVGRWTHLDDRSAWQSDATWRPLPRREHSKRSDYHVLLAHNRHTVTPDGWVHEQDNQKLVLDEDGQPVRVLAHEIGINTYDLIDGHDFSAGRDYWADTQAYWSDVRAMWADALDDVQTDTTRIVATLDDEPVWLHLFRVAQDVRDAGTYTSDHATEARTIIAAAIQKP